MPDRHGFNHFGSEVRCIEDGCTEGGILGAWSSERRAKHALTHKRRESSMTASTTKDLATPAKPDAKPASTKAAGRKSAPKATTTKATPAKADPAPPVEDVTGQEFVPEVKAPGKTAVARNLAVQVLQDSGEPMLMTDLVAAIHAINPDIHKGTIQVQVAAEAKADNARIKKVERATYAAVGK